MTRGTDISKFKQVHRERNEGDFPDQLPILLRKESDLKYGENPRQHGAIYSFAEVEGRNTQIVAQLTNLRYVRSDAKGKGGLSMTNTMDISTAMDVLKYFPEMAVAMFKHTTLSGFAKSRTGRSLVDLFRIARDCDRRSNFGCTVTSNRVIDMETAKALFELRGESPFFVDVLAAPGYEEGVVSYIEQQSKDMRLGEFSNLNCLPKFVGDETYGLVSIKDMPGGRVGVQDLFLTRIKSASDLILDPLIVDKEEIHHLIQRDPTPEELDDMLTAWYLTINGGRSNKVAGVRNENLVYMGSGKTERVGAVEDLIVRGMQKAMDRERIAYDPLMGIKGWEELKDNPFKGAVLGSDAFLPFGDTVGLFARVGGTAIVQPYGSTRDAEVIDAANKYGIAMPATLERCFAHR